jgi:hypothetical protein
MVSSFFTKKDMLAQALESYIIDSTKENVILTQVDTLLQDHEFMTKKLFIDLLTEYKKELKNIPKKRLKQDVLMIRSYL